MSKDITQIDGVHEFTIDERSRKVGYAPSRIFATSFSGGEERGRCVQLTVYEQGGSVASIQVTDEKMKEFLSMMNEFYREG
jgi:hypothetical protein